MIIKKDFKQRQEKQVLQGAVFPVNERLIPFYGSLAAFWRATTTKRPSSVW